MATIAKQTGPTAYPADITEFTFTAGTVTGSGGDVVTLTGRDILLVTNTDGATPYDVIITGPADPYGRTVTITHELAAGEFAIFGPIPLLGWANASGQLAVSVENAAVKLAVITLHSP